MKIGIYGGSFDPIHKGHIYMAESAMKQFSLDRLLLMPSYISPNKADETLVTSEHRIAMCQLASKHNPNISVSDYEASLSKVSYTYLTMQAFQKRYPNDERYFIMGGDSLDYFEKWIHPEIIAECAHILVLEREKFTVDEMEEKIAHIKSCFPASISIIRSKPFCASSTDIKKQLLNNPKECPKELNTDVYEYICAHHLYGL